MNPYRWTLPKKPSFWCWLGWHDWVPLFQVSWPHLGVSYHSECARCAKYREKMDYD